MKRLLSLGAALALALSLAGCGAAADTTSETAYDGATAIQLSDGGVTVDGRPADGDTAAAVYIANDIVYYEAGRDFTYGAGTEADAHTAAEAAAHTVVHITRPGTYVLSGALSAGQIAVDLGEDAPEDPEAVVTLVLDGVDLTCTVAPAILFYSVYECGSADPDTAGKDVDTAAAGANLVLADGSANAVSGSYVARIYQSYTLSDDGTAVVDSKKLHKYDGAVYSRMSMNVDGGPQGTGVLDIAAENEGLDSELHLTINGGVLNIRAGNDGINTNEDGVSVTTVNGGALTIAVDGATGEGDGIDSNGWIVINGGTVTAAACGDSMDGGLDADMGITLNGGTVLASGNMYDQIDGEGQTYAVFSFAQRQPGGTALRLEGAEGTRVLTPANDFTCLVFSAPDLTAGDYALWSGDTQLAGTAVQNMGGPGGMGGGGTRGGPPEGFDPAQAAPPAGDREMPGGQPPAEGDRPDGRPGSRPEGGGPGEAGEGGEATQVLSLKEGANFFNISGAAG